MIVGGTYLAKSFIISRHYSGLYRRYKRPIVTSYLPFKITTVMEKPSEFGSPLQGRSPWELFFSVMRLAEYKGYVLLSDRRKRKWIWVTLVALASIQSYFVRELLVALFFFTIFYVFLAALAVLYILIVDALDCGSVWVESLGRSFLYLARHHFASPVRVPSLPKDRAVRRIQKLDPD